MEPYILKKSIMVVEDELIVAEDLVQRLEKLGYDMLPYANTGEKALKVLEERKPDLILMDIRIKGDMDGIETAEIIGSKYSLPVVYLTSMSDEETIQRAKATEPYGFITKTANPSTIYTTIEMAIHRKRMEIEVREKEEILSVTLKSINDAVIGSTLDGTIISWNKGASDIFGYELHEIAGKNLSVLIPSSFPNEIPDKIDRVLRGENLGHYDTVRQDKNGKFINVSLKLSPIKNARGEVNGISIIAHDITEKRRLEKEILEISERESRRIGQDLHDNLGQHLTGIMLKHKVLEKSLKTKGLVEEADQANRITVYIKEAIELTRKLAKNLLKVNTGNQGISTALNELTSFYSTQDGPEIIYEADEDVDKAVNDQTVITQLYHIAQEALTNAIKHSNATVIKLTLTVDDSEICLQVADNGTGKTVKEETCNNGLGLSILKYRTNFMDGNLSIIGNKKTGTKVICRVPILGNKSDE